MQAVFGVSGRRGAIQLHYFWVRHMATRFGRRAADGTFEYHDSRESMIAAEGRENSDARAGLFGLIGLLVGGVLTYVGVVSENG